MNEVAWRLGCMADAMVSAKVGPSARFFSRERVDEIVMLLREAEKEILDLRQSGRIAINSGERLIATLRAERDQVKSALIGLVGASSCAELEQMEAVMRLMPAPAAEKAVTIDAIHALLSLSSAEPASAGAVDPVEGIVTGGPRA